MHELHEILWNPRISMKIDEKAASWNRVKVSLGASSRWQTLAEAAKPRPLKSMKSHEISWSLQKYIQIHEIHKILWNPWKSMKIDEKAASWNRVKVSLGASFRPQSVGTGRETSDPWNHEISWNLMKSLEIHINLWKCMKSMKSYEILGNLWKSMK